MQECGMKTIAEYVQIRQQTIVVFVATRPIMQTGRATEGGGPTLVVVGTAYGFGRPRRTII